MRGQLRLLNSLIHKLLIMRLAIWALLLWNRKSHLNSIWCKTNWTVLEPMAPVHLSSYTPKQSLSKRWNSQTHLKEETQWPALKTVSSTTHQSTETAAAVSPTKTTTTLITMSKIPTKRSQIKCFQSKAAWNKRQPHFPDSTTWTAQIISSSQLIWWCSRNMTHMNNNFLRGYQITRDCGMPRIRGDTILCKIWNKSNGSMRGRTRIILTSKSTRIIHWMTLLSLFMKILHSIIRNESVVQFNKAMKHWYKITKEKRDLDPLAISQVRCQMKLL